MNSRCHCHCINTREIKNDKNVIYNVPFKHQIIQYLRTLKSTIIIYKFSLILEYSFKLQSLSTKLNAKFLA